MHAGASKRRRARIGSVVCIARTVGCYIARCFIQPVPRNQCATDRGASRERKTRGKDQYGHVFENAATAAGNSLLHRTPPLRLSHNRCSNVRYPPIALSSMTHRLSDRTGATDMFLATLMQDRGR